MNTYSLKIAGDFNNIKYFFENVLDIETEEDSKDTDDVKEKDNFFSEYDCSGHIETLFMNIQTIKYIVVLKEYSFHFENTVFKPPVCNL